MAPLGCFCLFLRFIVENNAAILEGGQLERYMGVIQTTRFLHLFIQIIIIQID